MSRRFMLTTSRRACLFTRHGGIMIRAAELRAITTCAAGIAA